MYLKNQGPRFENVRSAFVALSKNLAIEGKRVLIKPNFTSCDHVLANTHPDALRAVLETVSSFNPKEIVVAEGSGESWGQGKTTNGTIMKFGAWDCIEAADAKFIDLNGDADYIEMDVETIYGQDKVRINNMFLEYDIRISMTVPKSHDYAVMTSSTKNFAMPMVKPQDRVKIHGLRHHTSEGEEYQKSVKLINHNLANLVRIVYPTISIIDGFVGMEGNGPIVGTPIPLGWALISDNPLACDCALAELMGIKPKDVGYLNYLCAGTMPRYPLGIKKQIIELSKIFKLHKKIKMQERWK